MYNISALSASRQGDELFQLELDDGSKHEFHIWDYAFLYRYPHLYRQLIVELLDCKVYQILETQLRAFIPENTKLNILDVACGSGLMGRYLKDSSPLQVNYLAGIDVIPEALEALKRDNPDIYHDHLLASDDHQKLKTKELNCLIICGAANHIRLQDFQYYFRLLTKPCYIVFNLLEHKTPEILHWLDEQCELLHSEPYNHRKLMNGSSVKHRAFIYQASQKSKLAFTPKDCGLAGVPALNDGRIKL